MDPFQFVAGASSELISSVGVEPSEDSGLTVCETRTIGVEGQSTPSSPLGLPPGSGEDLGRVGGAAPSVCSRCLVTGSRDHIATT